MVCLCPPKSLPENRVLVQLSVLLTETQGMKGTFRDGETSLGMTLENQKQTLKHFVLTQLWVGARTLPIDPPGGLGAAQHTCTWGPAAQTDWPAVPGSLKDVQVH